jgi:putative NADH-flavin reductase
LNGSENIEKAVEESGVKRLIVVGGAGSLYTPDNVQIVDTRTFRMLTNQEQRQEDYLNKIKAIILRLDILQPCSRNESGERRNKNRKIQNFTGNSGI